MAPERDETAHVEEESPPRQSRWIEIATGLAVVAIVVVAAAFYPPTREALDSGRRSLATFLGAGDWTGYYLGLDPTAKPGEASTTQLLFAEGSFRGRGVRVVDPPVFAGSWAPSGEVFAFTSGRSLLLADKRGGVRSLGELLDLTPAGPPVWVNENELVITMARAQPLGRSYVRIDASGILLDQRALPTSLTMDSVSADGRHALARSSIGLELIDLSDGTIARAPDGLAYVGWLGDGRVLVRTIRAGLWQLEARLIGAGLGQPLAELRTPFEVSTRGSWVAILEKERTGDATTSISLLGPGSALRRVLNDIPDLTDAQPTADGRYMTFTTRSADDPRARTGFVEIASGAVTHACDKGCAALRLR